MGRAAVARILAVLAALTAMAPLSMDIYTPSLPQMRVDLDAPIWVIQAGITACLLGIGIGQLVWGPLSDRYGRRPVIFAGVLGWTLASVVSAIAPDAVLLIAVRGLAGLCGAAGIVVARSVVRDLSPDTQTVSSRIGLLALVTAVAPILAPLAGAGLAAVWGWRADFVALAALGGALTLAFALTVPETLPARLRARGRGLGILSGLRRAVADRELLWVAIAIGAHAVGFYAYITTTSFIVEEQLGYPPTVFALVFGTNAVAMFAANLAFRRLARRHHPSVMLGAGLATATAASAVLLLLALLTAPPWMLWVASTVAVGGTAFVLTGAHSWGQATVTLSGAASALTGAAQFLGGVAGSPLTGLIGTTSTSLAAVMTLSAAVGLAAWTRARRRQRLR